MSNLRPHERRSAPRHEIHAEITFSWHGDPFSLPVRNLSTGGAYVVAVPERLQPLAVGTRFQLTITLPDDSRGEDDEGDLPSVVRCRGRVIRRDTGDGAGAPGAGILFEELDANNLARLRALIIRASRDED